MIMLIHLLHHSVHQHQLIQFGTKVRKMYQNQQINLQLLLSTLKVSNAKMEIIWNVIDTRKPEIVVVSKTCLNNSIHNSEVLPTNYEVYHKDMIDGGVFIAVKKIDQPRPRNKIRL